MISRLLGWDLLAIVFGVVSLPAVSLAQGPVTIELSLSNPGARAIAFAGAFSAIADNATAAFANPAGLVQLLRPEVSPEGRRCGVRELPGRSWPRLLRHAQRGVALRQL